MGDDALGQNRGSRAATCLGAGRSVSLDEAVSTTACPNLRWFGVEWCPCTTAQPAGRRVAARGHAPVQRGHRRRLRAAPARRLLQARPRAHLRRHHGAQRRGEPADPVTVADELRRAGLIDHIGGAATLLSLQGNTPATSNAGRYAKIIEDHALLRRMIGVAGEIAELSYDLPEDVAKAVDTAESMVFEVAQRRVVDSMAPSTPCSTSTSTASSSSTSGASPSRVSPRASSTSTS